MLTAYCNQTCNLTEFQIKFPRQSGRALYWSNPLFTCHGSVKEKIVCKGIEDHLMDKISAIISDDSCSSCIPCQIPGDIMFSRASSMLLLSNSSNSWVQWKVFVFSISSVYYFSSLSWTSAWHYLLVTFTWSSADVVMSRFLSSRENMAFCPKNYFLHSYWKT